MTKKNICNEICLRVVSNNMLSICVKTCQLHIVFKAEHGVFHIHEQQPLVKGNLCSFEFSTIFFFDVYQLSQYAWMQHWVLLAN